MLIDIPGKPKIVRIGEIIDDLDTGETWVTGWHFDLREGDSFISVDEVGSGICGWRVDELREIARIAETYEQAASIDETIRNIEDFLRDAG